jgi:hypothetical protein
VIDALLFIFVGGFGGVVIGYALRDAWNYGRKKP